MSATTVFRPYKGLAPFDDEPLDALLFFGREREREIIVANLLASRLTVLYGPTGVGKSSLLRAGVAQRLRTFADSSVAIVSSWAEDPTEEIDEAIAAEGDTHLILDQIEEYFLYHDSDSAFVRRLPELVTEPGMRVNVLLGIREDSLARLDIFKNRIPNLFANYLRLDHLDRVAARSAIVGPLERLNELAPDEEPLRAEPELVEVALGQVATGRIEYGLSGRGVVPGRDESGRVEAPFLQLVLERLWDVEQEVGSHTLRLETLERLGGAETIVRQHLERALEDLASDQQALVAEMFEHLVTPSGTKIAHDVGDLARYARADRQDVADVLGHLVSERIVRPVGGQGGERGNGRYEIFHDVLADGVLAWRTAFESERELEHERRRRRRAISVAGIALFALAAVAAIALFALAQRERAENEATHAEAREQAAQALSDLSVDPQRSLRLAVAAAADERTPQIEEVLRRSLDAARLRKVLPARDDALVVAFGSLDGRVLVPFEDGVRAYTRRGRGAGSTSSLRGSLLAIGRDDTGLAVTAERRQAFVVDTHTGRLLQTLTLPGRVRSARIGPGRVGVVATNRDGRDFAYVFPLLKSGRARVFRHRGTKSIAFSSDGRLLATGSADNTARVWRIESGKVVRVLSEHNSDVLGLEFSPDGSLLATGSADSGVRVWSMATGERRFFFIGHSNPVVALAWSPDGRFLADASLDRTARVLDIGGVSAGRVAITMIGHKEGVTALAYSADGRTLATVSNDGTARLWDARAEHELLSVTSHRPGMTRAVFDPSGRLALSYGVDGAVVTDVRRRRRVATVGETGAIRAGRFDPSGRRVVIAGPNGAFVFTAGGRRLATLVAGAAVADARFSADGRRVITAGFDGYVRSFTSGGRELASILQGSSPVTSLAVRDDGLVASGAADGTVRLSRFGSATETVLTGHSDAVTALRFSPDGSRLLSGADDGFGRVWDSESGALHLELPGHGGGLSDAVFSPSGQTIVTTSRARAVVAWDARTGEILRDYVGQFAAVNSADFSSDGRWLVTTSSLAAALWQRGIPMPFAYLRGHSAPLRSADFSPTSHRVLTAGDDGTVRLYVCDLCGGIDELVSLAKLRLEAATSVR